MNQVYGRIFLAYVNYRYYYADITEFLQLPASFISTLTKQLLKLFATKYLRRIAADSEIT